MLAFLFLGDELMSYKLRE